MKAELVTGARGPRKGRDGLRPGWTDRAAVWSTLDRHAPDILIVGDADGVDLYARTWARFRRYGDRLQVFEAAWERYGNGAGPRRNRAMARRLVAYRDLGYDVRVTAFHDDLEASRGTADMLEVARGFGIRRTVVSHNRR